MDSVKRPDTQTHTREPNKTDWGNEYQDMSALHNGPEEAEGMTTSCLLQKWVSAEKEGTSRVVDEVKLICTMSVWRASLQNVCMHVWRELTPN